MDIEWFADFIELTSVKNFTIAAKNRNRSQSAFSRRIAGLEQWVGVSLIDRSVSPFQITREGEYFKRSAQAIVDDVKKTVKECRQYQKNEKSVINFTASHTLAINFFADWLVSIREKFAPIRSVLQANNVNDCVNLLQSGQAEFMMSYESPMINIKRNLYRYDFLAHKLTCDELLLVTAVKNGVPIHNLTNSKPIDYLAYSADSFIGRITTQLIVSQSLLVNCIYENALAESIKSMVISGVVSDGYRKFLLVKNCRRVH